MSTYTPEHDVWHRDYPTGPCPDAQGQNGGKHYWRKGNLFVACTLCFQEYEEWSAKEIARQTTRAAINERYAQYLEFVLMDMRQTMGQDRIDAVNAERDKTIKALDALEKWHDKSASD